MTAKHFFITLCIIMSTISFSQNQKTLRIGHRGAMAHVAENTVESIQKAVEMNCDMIEIDVYKIKDDSLIVFHDAVLERVTNGTGYIEDYTYAELQPLWVKGEYKIPMLSQVIEAIDKKAILNIELKGSDTAEKTHEIIRSFLLKGWQKSDFIISSFRWDELKKMREIDSSIAIAVLTEQEPLEAIAFAQEIRAVAINPYFEKLTPFNVQKIKDAGLLIYPWTVNEYTDIRKMYELKVDGIITNYPERIE
ncbi:glycerophosphodiester phosphodiesterase [Myroides indicus]|uniref:Glycerophosphoryl diester phosphodiesterase n=1 Tax=Myroides indicus TaxID=1323422 RepID=A0A4R7ETY6_9FLAO|nr:glycerophosphodiester phosphodiesterase family protein [Myroides indicus]TDS56516.1 glycerophosphoryl diester phosphodiesterase [Myroides indicus]